MSDNAIRIGTRDSQLALWQAHKVADLLEALHIKTKLVCSKSTGDFDLIQPIYSMGIQGVFTKTLDIALLENQFDIAVHSLKDVPTQLPEGLFLAAVLQRGSAIDILVQNDKMKSEEAATIATGSLRRKAQWLHRYPHHQLVNLRGNVQTRMNKLFSSQWEGAIFAKAGLERAALLGCHFQELEWMIPAPAQGAIGIVCKMKDETLVEQLKQINHRPTQMCVDIERNFLHILEGGCSAPIGAHAVIDHEKIEFKAGVFSFDGQKAATLHHEVEIKESEILAANAAQELLSKGGNEIMKTIKYSKE